MEVVEFRIDVLPTNTTLNDFRKAAKYIDVIVNGFACHRCELAAACEYFDVLFCSQFEDSNKDGVTLEEISNEILEKIIDLIYTGIVKVNSNEIDTFLEYSDYLGLRYLQMLCVHCIEKNVYTTQNFHEICLRSMLRSSSSVNQILTKYLAENIFIASQCDSFVDLPFVYLKGILKVTQISNSKTFFESADSIVVLKKWLHTNFEKRFIHLQSLLSFFPLEKLDELWKEMIVSEKINYVTLKENTQKIITVELPPEKGTLEMFVQFEDRENREMGLLSLALNKTNEWVALTREDKEIKYPVVDYLKTVSILNRKYVFTYEGGENKFWTDFYEEKNLLKKPYATFRTFNLAPIKNYIYLCGEIVGTPEDQHKLYIFNIETGLWMDCISPVTPDSILLPIENSQLCIINHKEIFLFDHRMHKFIKAPRNRRNSTKNFSACVYDGDVYICGGYEADFTSCFSNFNKFSSRKWNFPQRALTKPPSTASVFEFGKSSTEDPDQNSSNIVFNIELPKCRNPISFAQGDSSGTANGSSKSFNFVADISPSDPVSLAQGSFSGTAIGSGKPFSFKFSGNPIFPTTKQIVSITEESAKAAGPCALKTENSVNKSDSRENKSEIENAQKTYSDDLLGAENTSMYENVFVKKSSDFHSLDLRNYKWSNLEGMLSEKANHFMVPYNNKLWIVDRKLKGEIYNPVCKQWHPMTPIPKQIEVNSKKYEIVEVEDIFTC